MQYVLRNFKGEADIAKNHRQAMPFALQIIAQQIVVFANGVLIHLNPMSVAVSFLFYS